MGYREDEKSQNFIQEANFPMTFLIQKTIIPNKCIGNTI